MERIGGSWIAFTVMAVAIVGLAGIFATFALPIPMERAMLLDATLDDALAARNPLELDGLRARLGERADEVIGGTGPVEARVQHARADMRTRFLVEEEATERWLRWLIGVVTAVVALFVGAIVGAVSRRPPPPA